jgi:hypothetical protein
VFLPIPFSHAAGTGLVQECVRDFPGMSRTHLDLANVAREMAGLDSVAMQDKLGLCVCGRTHRQRALTGVCCSNSMAIQALEQAIKCISEDEKDTPSTQSRSQLEMHLGSVHFDQGVQLERANQQQLAAQSFASALRVFSDTASRYPNEFEGTYSEGAHRQCQGAHRFVCDAAAHKFVANASLRLARLSPPHEAAPLYSKAIAAYRYALCQYPVEF